MGTLDQTALRREAERRVATDTTWDPSAQRLSLERSVEELKIYQIELEIQQESMSEAYAEADAMRAKYQDLFELAPVGIFTLSYLGEILEANQAACDMFGIAGDKITGKQFRQFFHNQSLADLELIMTTSRQRTTGVVGETLWVRRPLGLPVFVNAHVKTTRDLSTGSLCIRVVLSDVSALKCAREDMARAIERGSDFGSLA